MHPHDGDEAIPRTVIWWIPKFLMPDHFAINTIVRLYVVRMDDRLQLMRCEVIVVGLVVDDDDDDCSTNQP